MSLGPSGFLLRVAGFLVRPFSLLWQVVVSFSGFFIYFVGSFRV
jgi:hypothetical protein